MFADADERLIEVLTVPGIFIPAVKGSGEDATFVLKPFCQLGQRKRFVSPGGDPFGG